MSGTLVELQAGAALLFETVTFHFRLFDPVDASHRPVLASRIAYSGRWCSVGSGSGKASDSAYVPAAAPAGMHSRASTRCVFPGVKRRGSTDSLAVKRAPLV